jgi:16S rRNA (cytosine1402-N4)-methyltransferase
MTAGSPSFHGEPSSKWQTDYHSPALAHEVVTLLGAAALVLDGTLGGGGHAAALLEAGVGRVIGIDRDPDALAEAGARLAADRDRFAAYQGNYAAIDAIPAIDGLRFNGILLDLGISSHQIDDASRGFSFREGAPLDMRMGGTEDDASSAAELLDSASDAELTSIFRDYGDEPRAGRLAREIVRRRATRPFRTSDDLVGAIRGALGARTGPADFARLFQAVRIAVNDELAGLEHALPALRDRLAPRGTLAVIAYHSGEDRLVKHAFRAWSTECICPPRLPVCACGSDHALGETVTRRAIVASPDEIARNPRARSARLRAWRAK